MIYRKYGIEYSIGIYLGNDFRVRPEEFTPLVDKLVPAIERISEVEEVRIVKDRVLIEVHDLDTKQEARDIQDRVHTAVVKLLEEIRNAE